MSSKILLAILPYWDPMIPPMGITTLKRFLQNKGHNVKTVDLIVQKECLDFYYSYFVVLEKSIPVEKRGNFRNIGHDVLQNHLMAAITSTNEKDTIDLIKILIYHYYYFSIEDEYAIQLKILVDNFYILLRRLLQNILAEEKPEVFGVTAYKCTLPASIFAIKLVKEYNPSIVTVMGGGTFNESHAPDSPSFDKLLEFTEGYLDHIILGPGELLFEKLLSLELPKQRVYSKTDIGGTILPLSKLPIPDFSDLNLNLYPYLAATASTSCIYSCSFCVAKKISGPYTKKSIDQVIYEMTCMHEMYGNQLFFMTDSLINPVITDLAKGFSNSRVALYYDAYFKVDFPSGEIKNTLLWRQGGLYRVRLGTESGSQKILDAMNKDITIEQIRATIKALAYAGIKTTTYWVIGHPGETEEDFQATLDLIEELKDDIFQAECNYFLYHYSKQANEEEWAKYRIPLFPDWVNNLLLFKHWTLDFNPLREETFKRVHRFDAHCKKLGIPNPYSIKEHFDADNRWQKLHKHAVPALVEFKDRANYINECKNITIPVPAKTTHSLNEDFNL